MDGTLLHSKGNLTETSCRMLQPLIERGLPLAIATGRTRDNALGAIKPLKLTHPVICDNGTLIFDPVKSEFISKKFFTAKQARYAISLIREHKVYPFINTYDEGSIVVYYSLLANIAQQAYYTQRSAYGLSGYIRDEGYTKFSQSSAFNFSMLDTPENLMKLYEKLKSDENYTSLMFPAEYFEGFFWLEILPAGSGKGQAVDFLINMYKPKKVVCFGDNLNDLCMFERADIKVAPSNAVEEIRKAADIIIGHCDDDSVAKYISQDFDKLENEVK